MLTRLADVTGACQRALACGRSATADVARTLLMEIGELESGIVDALCPERDEPHPVERLARTASTAAGRLFGDVLRTQRPPWRSVHHLYQAVCALRAARVPEWVSVSVAEGYAYYALYPESYLEAAHGIAHDWPHGTRAAVIGLRGIGTSLSAAVTAGLEEQGASVASWTVRPRGHPFSRELRPGANMSAAWAASTANWWLVVDEGPGLSGSSLASAARALTSAGVDRDRVVLVPHWRPDIARFAPEVRAIWARHRVVAASDASTPGPAAHARRAFAFLQASDWSGGRWREALVGRARDWPAVHPGHERLKWSTADSAEPSMRLVKFAGLGPYGRRVADRAQAAADAGFAPPVLACRDGWLATTLVRGRPVGARHATTTFVDRMADYVAWLDAQPPAAAAADWGAVEHMTAVNARELLGDGAAETIATAFALARPALDDRPPQLVDGRLLPHEWIAGDTRYWKTDAAEHADDHFFPGPLDVAWDVAAVLAEFAWPEPAREHFIDRYVRLTGDRGLAERLPICGAAYLAFRAGYAALAVESLSDADEIARFDAARRRYTAQFRRAVDALRADVRRAAVGARRAADRDRRA